jgi:DNA-binding transcriptional regulator YhcF (GntR family)
MTISVADGLRAGLSKNAAIMIGQISFWHPKAKAEWGGLSWWAHTHHGMAQNTGLSVHQVRRALAELKQRGLVVTEQHKFGVGFDCKAQTFVRPLVTLLGQGCETQVAQNCETQVVQKCKTLKSTDETTEEHTESSVHSHATSDPGLYEEIPGETCMVAPKPRAKTVAEVLMSSPKILKKPPAVSIADRWRDVVIEVHGGYFVPLTMKQRGQLKHLRKVCPPGKAADIVEHALRNWLEFVTAAEDDAGAYNTPAQPSIAFLVKYVAVAVQLIAPKPVPMGFQPKPKIEVKLTAKPPVPGSEKATLEEVLAIMADPVGSSG